MICSAVDLTCFEQELQKSSRSLMRAWTQKKKMLLHISKTHAHFFFLRPWLLVCPMDSGSKRFIIILYVSILSSITMVLKYNSARSPSIFQTLSSRPLS